MIFGMTQVFREQKDAGASSRQTINKTDTGKLPESVTHIRIQTKWMQNSSICSLNQKGDPMTPDALNHPVSIISSEMKRRLESIKETACQTDMGSSGSSYLNISISKKRAATSNFLQLPTKVDQICFEQTHAQKAVSNDIRERTADGKLACLKKSLNLVNEVGQRPESAASSLDSSSCSGIEILMTKSDSCSALERYLSESTDSNNDQSIKSRKVAAGQIRLKEPDFSDDLSCDFSFELCYELEKDEKKKDLKNLNNLEDSTIMNVGLTNSQAFSSNSYSTSLGRQFPPSPIMEASSRFLRSSATECANQGVSTKICYKKMVFASRSMTLDQKPISVRTNLKMLPVMKLRF
jgi:hypothetical protein